MVIITIVRTAHHPVSYLNSKRNREGFLGRITKWALVLQGQSFEVQYSKKKNMKNVEGLVELHDCGEEQIELVEEQEKAKDSG